MQSAMMMFFKAGLFRASPLPPLDFIQMPSSPACTVQWNITAFWHDDKSMASPFCAEYSLKMVTLRMIILVQNFGFNANCGEFLNVGPSINTFLQLVGDANTGRIKSRPG